MCVLELRLGAVSPLCLYVLHRCQSPGGLCVFALLRIEARKLIVGVVVIGIGRYRGFQLGNCAGAIAARGEQLAKLVMGVGVAWIRTEHLPEQRLGFAGF